MYINKMETVVVELCSWLQDFLEHFLVISTVEFIYHVEYTTVQTH